MAYDLYDFTDAKGTSVIVTWRNTLTKRDKAQLDQKLNMLAISGMELPPKLLVGPIAKTGNIYKLRIFADVMLRPMLCKGPFDMNREFTLLLGAVEIQSKLKPDPKRAIENLNILVKDERRRIPHEWH
jgi:hypothetical protein